MADIELVIKIPETLKRITDEEDYKTFSHPVWLAILMDIIQNGTPLPNGHGDLKDIETFKLTYGNDGAYYRFKDIIDAPTIIEADKEDKE